jgi:hypothetical protein
MKLDMLLVGVVLVFSALGYLSGFRAQMVRLLVLASAYALAFFLGGYVGSGLSSAFGLPLLLARIAGTLVAFTGGYVVMSGIGWAVLHAKKRGRRPNEVSGDEGLRLEQGRVARDRWAGAMLSGCKALAILYLVICGLVLMEEPLARTSAGVWMQLNGSVAANLVRRFNVFSMLRIPVVGDMQTLGRLLQDESFRRKLADDPRIQKLAGHPEVKKLLNDPVILDAVRRNDLAALLGNQRIDALLRDPEMRALLGDLDLSRVE